MAVIQTFGRFDAPSPCHAKLEFSTRRGGRVVDRARLESGSTFTGTGSSNLPLSASPTAFVPGGERAYVPACSRASDGSRFTTSARIIWANALASCTSGA